MRKTYLLGIAVLVLTTIFITTSVYAVPNLISYQGKLTDPNGVDLNGIYISEFFIFTDKTGGTQLWSEQQTLLVENGIYNIRLGAVNSLSISLFNNDPLYLEVKIFNSATGWETLAPRERITSVAYAMKAGDADTVDGMHASDLEESAEIDTKIKVHKAVSNAHHTKTTSFTELTDTATDAQIPDNITIDYAATSGEADTLDGKHASEFLDTSNNNQNKAGGLNIGGNVGIGTTNPAKKLYVVGDIHSTGDITSDGSGIISSLTASILMYAGPSAPTGWLMCDGSQVSRTTYADLFAVIGTTYGPGDGSTTFNLPDLRQRFPLGKADTGTGSTLGDNGGAIDHTHSFSSSHSHTLPGHSHSFTTNDAGNHNHGGYTYYEEDRGTSISPGEMYFMYGTTDHHHAIGTDGQHNHTGNTTAWYGYTWSSTVSGNTSSNNPPFLVINYIIKY